MAESTDLRSHSLFELSGKWGRDSRWRRADLRWVPEGQGKKPSADAGNGMLHMKMKKTAQGDVGAAGILAMPRRAVVIFGLRLHVLRGQLTVAGVRHLFVLAAAGNGSARN